MIAIVIAIVLLACCFIKYPEIVRGNIKVQSDNAPKALLPNINGKIIRILKNNNEKVAKGDHIIYIESTANHEEVLTAFSKIEQLVKKISTMPTLDFTLFDGHISQYGELQTQIQLFKQSYLNYKDNLDNGIFEEKQHVLQKDIHIIEQLLENLNDQKKGAENELKYFEEKSKISETLYVSKTIARDENNTVQANYIAKRNAMLQFPNLKLNYEMQINQKKRELMELKQQAENEQALFIESLNTLKSQFDDWINKYIIKAPISGTLIFSSFIQENQLLQAGKPVGMINPEHTKNYIEMYISQQVYPKVKLNQAVILKFPAYPFQDYGYIKGNINYISSLPSDSGFLLKVNVSKGFITSQKVPVNIKYGMTGGGEIIVKDKTIIGRMISKLTERLRIYP